MKKNKFKFLVIGLSLIAGTVILQACKKTFLDAQPYGQYSTELITNKKGLEGLLVGAYAVLDGQGVSGRFLGNICSKLGDSRCSCR